MCFRPLLQSPLPEAYALLPLVPNTEHNVGDLPLLCPGVHRHGLYSQEFANLLCV